MWEFEFKGERFTSEIISGFNFKEGRQTKFEGNSFTMSEPSRPPTFELFFKTGAIRVFYGGDAIRINELFMKAIHEVKP